MTQHQKSEDLLEYGTLVGRLLKRIGYSHDAVILVGNLLVKKYGVCIYDKVMLKPGKPLMTCGWKDTAKKIAKHLSDGKQLFIDKKIITKDTEGVAEFLIKMALRV